MVADDELGQVVAEQGQSQIEVDDRDTVVDGLKQLRSARVISAGHAFVQNLRRGHYELGVDVDPQHRLPAAFTGLALAI